VRIPWIAWGDGVPRGGRVAHVSTLDTAATVLSLLGRATPRDWAGVSCFPFQREADASGGTP
jgi:arylsulfatase A-like enzyme